MLPGSFVQPLFLDAERWAQSGEPPTDNRLRKTKITAADIQKLAAEIFDSKTWVQVLPKTR